MHARWEVCLEGPTICSMCAASRSSPPALRISCAAFPCWALNSPSFSSKEHELDELIVQVEAVSEVTTDRYAEITALVEREIRSQCELRAIIEVLPQGTLPPTQFKAQRVRDLR